MMTILKISCLLPGAVLHTFNNSERVQHCCILGCRRWRVNPFADDGMQFYRAQRCFAIQDTCARSLWR